MKLSPRNLAVILAVFSNALIVLLFVSNIVSEIDIDEGKGSYENCV